MHTLTGWVYTTTDAGDAQPVGDVLNTFAPDRFGIEATGEKSAMKRTTIDDIQAGPWVVEWCATGAQRGLFHVDFLSNTIRRNMERFNGYHPQCEEWIVMGVFPDADKAHTFCSALERLQDMREKLGYE